MFLACKFSFEKRATQSNAISHMIMEVYTPGVGQFGQHQVHDDAEQNEDVSSKEVS